MMIQPDNSRLCMEYVFESGATTEEALALVGEIGEKLIVFWQKDGRIDSDSLFSLNLAYEELAANIARHSIAGSSGDVQVRCESSISDQGVRLSLYDNGPPFDPTAVMPTTLDKAAGLPRGLEENGRIGGMGLNLLRELFPDMAYKYENSNNSVHLVLKLIRR